MTDGTIEVHGLRVRRGDVAAPGCLVDVWVRADLDRAIASDSLADAIDIAAIAATVRSVPAPGTGTGLEALADDAARAILDRFGEARAVRVRVTAPAAGAAGDRSAERALER